MVLKVVVRVAVLALKVVVRVADKGLPVEVMKELVGIVDSSHFSVKRMSLVPLGPSKT